MDGRASEPVFAAARRAALRRLLHQPTASERRVCEGCELACSCDPPSPTCTCRCSPACPEATVKLTRTPKRPVHPAYVPVLYELSSLRLLTPLWPNATHYAAAEGSPRPIHFRSGSLVYAGLLAQRVRYLAERGDLSGTWRVAVEPHATADDECSFVIAPPDGAAQAGLWADLRVLGENLAAKIRSIARAKLHAIDAGRGRQPSGSRGPSITPREPLSHREREVLDLFLAGLSVASIGERLFISPHTVRNHLKRLFAKFGVASQGELRETFAGDAAWPRDQG